MRDASVAGGADARQRVPDPGASQIYQAGPVKSRRRRTAAQIETLEREIHEILRADHPQSIRHVFYRLTDPRLEESIEKSDRGYSQVQDRITRMRRAGTIPYGWISDATRRGYHVATYGSASEALRAWQASYRADLWASAGEYVEVWCESRSIAGIIQGTCRDLAVSLYPCGGFASLTLAHEGAQYISRMTRGGEIPAGIIYIGDYDPAGVLIDVSIEREIREHLPPAVDLSFRRLAVTPEQIETLALPAKPRKPGERRARHIRETVEAEAMPAGHMRELLRREIEAHLPEGALATAQVAEADERDLLRRIAADLDYGDDL